MILHHRITIKQPGGTDNHGDPLPGASFGPYPAEVQPLSNEEMLARGGASSTTRLKVILRARLPGFTGPILSTDSIIFDGITYRLDGDAADHYLQGRLHHREAVVKRELGG